MPFFCQLLAISLSVSAILITVSPPARASAIITGTVEAQETCAKDPMEAWLSSGSTLLYQVEIPQNGTFEFHVNSGKYNVVVISSNGCLAETAVEARENDTRHMVLKPSPAAKSPKPDIKKAALEWLMPSAWATGIGPFHPLYEGTDCPFCGQSSYFAPPVPFFSTQYQPPWWMGYGAMTYPNFFSPGPWINNGMYSGMYNSNPYNGYFSSGINGSLYPGQGGSFAAKPILYVNGPDGTPIKIRTRLTKDTQWLVAVPGHGESAWSGTIQKNRLISADADYRYIYYDYRMDEKKLQDSNGFCTRRGELIPRLAAALKGSGFKANEIKDFTDSWTIKIPPSERYCVYPQSNSELQAIATLEIEPKPSQFKQVLFIVQFGENLDGKGKFHSAPIASWKPTIETREPAAATVQIREWGVGFLQAKPR